MGSGLSRVSQGEHSHKRYKASTRRPPIKIDKNKIGIPTDFRHTYHVGNASPISEKMLGNRSTGALKTSTALVSDTEFIETMAQITDALQKVPLEKYTHTHYSNNVKTIHHSNYDLRRAVSSYNDRTVPTSEKISRKAIHKKVYQKHDDCRVVPEQQKKRKSDDGDDFPRSFSAQVVERNGSRSFYSRKPPLMNSMMEFSHEDYYDFGSCLQTKINAQIEYARARSNKSRSPNIIGYI
ncbi:hypothetical protein K501DRAFT_265425 [Backusella circina FSU 941]|nr:hypothetical protein K501DRAFT_265425 [Backusella circina FSU 941]